MYRRPGHNSKKQTRTTGSVEGMEGVIREHVPRISLEKTEVRRVGQQREEFNKVMRSNKWMAFSTLEGWLRRLGIQRQKCDVGHKREGMLGE